MGTFVQSPHSTGNSQCEILSGLSEGHRSGNASWTSHLRYFSPVVPSQERDKSFLGWGCPVYGTAAFCLCHCSQVILLPHPSRLQRGVKLGCSMHSQAAQETSLTDHEWCFQNKSRDLSPLISIFILPHIAAHLLSSCEHPDVSSRLCCVRASAYCAFSSLADFGKNLPIRCCREV